MVYFFNKNLDLINNCFKGSGLKHLNKKDFKKISIFSPNIQGQNIINKIIQTLINEKENYEKILKEEEKKFTFLLEELMSGRLRVKI